MLDNLFSTAWLEDFEQRIESALFPPTASSAPLPPWRQAAQKYVRKKPSCHLFVCCNYNPEPRLNHPAADYKTAALNLYRFTKDTGPVVRKWADICYGHSFAPKKPAFDECLRQVELVRAVIAHNNSSQNGLREVVQLDSYAQWCIGIIGKKAPAADGDYVVLLGYLQQLNDTICDYLEDGLQHLKIQNAASRKNSIQHWEELILDFFTSNGVKSDILKSYLISTYCDKQSINYPSDSHTYHRLRKASTAWLHQQYFHDNQICKLRISGLKNPEDTAKAQVLQQERDLWERAARAQLRPNPPPSTRDVENKMNQLCEYDFFNTGLKAYWQFLRKTGSQLPSMLPNELLPKYIAYKLDPQIPRVPT